MGSFFCFYIFRNPKFPRVGFSSKQGGIFMNILVLLIGCCLGSLATQYLFKRHTSGGTFIIGKNDEGNLAMFISFDEDDPRELAKSDVKYIILERVDE